MAEGKFVQTRADFNLCVENISKLNDFSSPQVMVQGIPWNLYITKNMMDNEEWLSVYLYCKNGDTSCNWAVAASVTIQLISSRNKLNTIAKEIAPFFFDCKSNRFGLPQFIKIKVVDPNDKYVSKLQVDFNKCCDESTRTTLKLTVNNIENLMAVRTPEFVLQNLHWDLTVFKYSSGLGLRLSCKEMPSSLTIKYKAKVDFRIKSSIAGVQDIEKTGNTELIPVPFNLNIYRIILWDELFKPENGFIFDNSIAFEVKIKVDKMEGSTKVNKRRASNPAEAETLECSICFESMKGQEVSSTNCGHLFCSKCIEKII
ncbi:uncharacterized protein LOC129567215 [Sitodiplosis mosellana]|uniref:uncharacterized protein LOC129567215 n=1 Tax=Sitodiplosis mosellana TaxID=263140 RepID=UPI002443A7B7|nr:uncharacterized protein LOC129567215 [Sitodiplosis mosellana]